jgi:predicted MPP superfamily phosphohydrolase
LKKSSFVIFFSIVLSVYGLANFYVFITGWRAIPASYEIYYIALFMFLSLSYLTGRFLERKYPGRFSSALIWIGSLWLAAIVYFLLFTILIDLLRLINFIVPFYPAYVYSDYRKFKLIIFFVVTAVVVLIVLFGYLNARSPRIMYLNLEIPKKTNGLKQLTIAVASDIHLGTIICKSRLEKIVNIINSLDADLVLLPGDVVDEDIGSVIRQNLGETLRKIKSKYGVYGITGNHEYIGGVEPACKYLVEHGIIELRDSAAKVADSFYIVGREDRSIKGFAGKTRKTFEELMQGVDKSLPIILMDHQPVHLEEAEQNGIDLQLSGHTHHGQLWPFNFITKKVYELSRGYKKRGKTHYYVSCGVGTWGPPVRTGNRPEVISIVLEFL